MGEIVIAGLEDYFVGRPTEHSSTVFSEKDVRLDGVELVDESAQGFLVGNIGIGEVGDGLVHQLLLTVNPEENVKVVVDVVEVVLVFVEVLDEGFGDVFRGGTAVSLDVGIGHAGVEVETGSVESRNQSWYIRLRW